MPAGGGGGIIPPGGGGGGIAPGGKGGFSSSDVIPATLYWIQHDYGFNIPRWRTPNQWNLREVRTTVSNRGICSLLLSPRFHHLDFLRRPHRQFSQ